MGEVKINRSLAGVVGQYESIELGQDNITAVTDKYKVPFVFTGKIHNVTIELK